MHVLNFVHKEVIKMDFDALKEISFNIFKKTDEF